MSVGQTSKSLPLSERIVSEVIVGKDILELVSSSMYVEPATIFREYIQNAADSIDLAKSGSLLSAGECGSIEITLDATNRSIVIRDNGAGIRASEFPTRLMAFGASMKRGTSARGFRGVGRLAGLGYCQELAFRSRGSGDSNVSELRWDCRKLRSALRDPSYRGNLTELAKDVTELRELDPSAWPHRFFEVELKGVVRHRNDRLLNPAFVKEYISQVAPVPFSREFPFSSEVEAALARYVPLANLEIRLTDEIEPITRPHSDKIALGDGKFDSYRELSIHEISGVNGEVAAIAWIAHHDYSGALPASTLLNGLRVRCGNIQVGGHTLLEELFPEARFNSWTVGEVHIVDRRIVPNGRRDQFEQSVHFDNVLNQLAPVAREVARRCRESSVERKRQRELILLETSIREKLEIVAQGTLGASKRTAIGKEIYAELEQMEKLIKPAEIFDDSSRALEKKVKSLRKLAQGRLSQESPSALSKLPAHKKAMYEQMFALIYECAANRAAAKALVDRMLQRL